MKPHEILIQQFNSIYQISAEAETKLNKIMTKTYAEPDYTFDYKGIVVNGFFDTNSPEVEIEFDTNSIESFTCEEFETFLVKLWELQEIMFSREQEAEKRNEVIRKGITEEEWIQEKQLRGRGNGKA